MENILSKTGNSNKSSLQIDQSENQEKDMMKIANSPRRKYRF